MTFNVAQLIAAKRDGEPLSRGQIESLISRYVAGELPDYQMSALAMAIFFRGMSLEETVDLTRAMRDSGQTLDWSGLRPVGDKHSTGGIGDKVSIALAPALAACGLRVPMISGRGLGTTGGTLDKLESIPGYRCDLSVDEFRDVVTSVGCSITGTTDDIAPADRKLYALRDVTGTVPSIPLITASILSKKLAAGLDSLVLDVKWGSGAFMRTLDQAEALARSLVAVANELGVKTTALLTDMNQPLGCMIGNAVEVTESLEILEGKGPADVRRLVIALGAQLLVDAGLCSDTESAERQLGECLDDGSARQRFERMVAAQGGRLGERTTIAAAHDFCSRQAGFVRHIDCEKIGLAIIELGGGRRKLGDEIDSSVGLAFHARIGDWMEPGQSLATVFSRGGVTALVESLLANAIDLAESPQVAGDLIVETITAAESAT